MFPNGNIPKFSNQYIWKRLFVRMGGIGKLTHRCTLVTILHIKFCNASKICQPGILLASHWTEIYYRMEPRSLVRK
ncbi:hypothetical protein SUGI_0447660 [Cryptomeria japonica]|nr:hypothetical protein SUGI_0447660 [Cryptomeria japonica]